MSKATANPNGEKKAVRCAIYTRKSTEEGLQQEFNTLDAQRESGEAYIAAQKHEGWVCLPDRYDDGGFTGGNMDRPAVRRLMKDIEAGKVDCVVVYKVDRLSRSLMDFAKMMETFDRHKVSFVSVTQQFNTSFKRPAGSIRLIQLTKMPDQASGRVFSMAKRHGESVRAGRALCTDPKRHRWSPNFRLKDGIVTIIRPPDETSHVDSGITVS